MACFWRRFQGQWLANDHCFLPLLLQGPQDGVHLGPSKSLEGSVDCFLTPEDLVHLTRRSLFLVVDSENSNVFMRLQGAELGRQAFCLMSPQQRPFELGEASKTGNLMTMFLTGPLMGFCLVAGNVEPSIQQLVDMQVCDGARGKSLCYW